MSQDSLPAERPAAPWSLTLAFALLYVTWGTTYFAIRVGVQHFPPALFGGTRIGLAGLLLLAYLVVRRQPLRLPRGEMPRLAVGALCLFVGGNGLITLGQKFIDSGVAAVLVATTPLWIGLLETVSPWGDRLTAQGWLGLLAGLAGVVLLLVPRLTGIVQHLLCVLELGGAGPGTGGDNHDLLWSGFGALCVVGSAASWALGTFLLRHRRPTGSPLTVAAYQMVLGGAGLVLIGLCAGEAGRLSPADFTADAVAAFFYLLVVSSLVGFIAFIWLLSRVSAALVGTYAYVNPVVAILVGRLLGGEEITGWILGGMAVILAGVALVRAGGVKAQPEQRPLYVLEQQPAEANGRAPLSGTVTTRSSP